ncbi:MAG: glycosyltransferase, partial [Bacteroidales bacterium]
AMLGVESGVSIFDFDGTLQTRLEALELANPEMTFDEMYERHLKDFDGLIRLNQISPRCFEAAALRTLMILYEGDYSGCLTPWRHFVPLKKDHSNMDEVVAVLRDPPRAQEIIDNAYREVALNPAYSFAAAVAQFDTVIDQNMTPAHAGGEPYDDASFEAARRALGPAMRLRLFKRRAINALHRLIYGVLLRNASDVTRKRVQRVLRATLRGLKAVLKAGR